MSNFDVIQEIRDDKQQINEFTVSWMKAHQGNKILVDKLLLDAQLNVMTDTDMNRFCTSTPLHLEPATAPITLPLLKAIITVNGCTITSNLQQWLQDNYTTSDIFEHICTKTNLIIDKMNLINWDNLGNALECQCLKTTVQLVKFMHNWLNTGHQKQKL